MKYFVLLLLLTLVYSASLFAQTPAPLPDVLPTPYAETTEAWQSFAPAEEQFSLEVPGAITPNIYKNRTPTNADNSSSSPDELEKTRRYLALVGGDYYYIFSEPIDSPDLNKSIY